MLALQADFEYILVYDVSRWGRFQDVDESAHYEFICKQAGIKVAYCAEQFDNDGSMISSIVKNIKRVMAAEYSRELSQRFTLGVPVASLGFQIGGPVAYALQRVLVNEKLQPKGILEKGDRKYLQTTTLGCSQVQPTRWRSCSGFSIGSQVSGEGRDLSSRQTQYVVKDLEIGKPINSDNVQKLQNPRKLSPASLIDRHPTSNGGRWRGPFVTRFSGTKTTSETSFTSPIKEADEETPFITLQPLGQERGLYRTDRRVILFPRSEEDHRRAVA